METLKEIISNLESNQIITTLIGGGVVVTIFRYFKEIFGWIKKFITDLISFKISMRYTTDYDIPEIFKKLLYLINEHSTVIWARTVEFSKSNGNWYDSKISTLPHGSSYRLMYGSFIHILKEYESSGMKVVTNIDIRVFFAKKSKFLSKLEKDTSNVSFKNPNSVLIGNNIGDWSLEVEKKKRFSSSVYSNNNSIDFIVNDIKKFIKNEELYNNCNIPYKRNYLFYGKPGTGKTSAALVVASEVDYNIVCIDIASQKLSDVMRIMIGSPKSIFLFEDIDAITKNVTDRDEEKNTIVSNKESELTLGQLLNITDGLITRTGSICIFTTNHIEKLDSALLRDGRMDVKVEFTYLNSDTANKMIKDKLGYTIENIKDEINPSHLQESILQVLLTNKTKQDLINEYSK